MVDLARHLDPAPDDPGGRGREGRVLTTSVITVAYHSGESLGRLLSSLESEAPGEVIVVDNGGELEDREGVRLIKPGRNLGYGAGNNLAAAEATGDALVFLNPDTVVTPGALAGLVAPLDDPSVGIVTARLRLLDDPETLNSAGNRVHVTGIGWAGRHGEPAESVSELEDVPFPSGAAMAIRRDLFGELGGFTEELFLYQEDLVLGWRARLLGLRVVVNPAADVLHDYDFSRNPGKQYWLERNRLVFVLSSFSPRLLALLAPVLASAEVGMLALAVKEGWGREKVRGWGWLLRHAGWLRRQRRETQRLRRVRDRELAPYLSPVIAPAMIPVSPPVRAINPLVARYWELVKKLL